MIYLCPKCGKYHGYLIYNNIGMHATRHQLQCNSCRHVWELYDCQLVKEKSHV